MKKQRKHAVRSFFSYFFGVAILVGSMMVGGCTNPTAPSEQGGLGTLLDNAPSANSGQEIQEPTESDVQTFNSPSGLYSLTYDANFRQETEAMNRYSEFERMYRNKNIYAMIITENISLSFDELENAALLNAVVIDPNARIISRSEGTQGSIAYLELEIEATIQNQKFRYLGRYYSVENGIIQALTHTTENMFAANKPIMTSFFEGIDIQQNESTLSRGVETFIPPHNGYALTFDSGVRNELPRDNNDIADLQLQHQSNNAFLTVVYEEGSIDMDAFREQAFLIFLQSGESANIDYEEPIIVNGNDIWVTKVSLTIDDIPLTYLNYYYVQNGVGIQFSAYTLTEDFDTYKDDIKAVFDTIIIN